MRFNATVVRLKGGIYTHTQKHNKCFNATVVRLKGYLGAHY